MPRKRRVEYPGAIYHVMNRGDRGEAIFYDDDDRRDFLRTLANACRKTGFEVHAYCLMANHFHAVIETPHGNLVAGMQWLLSSYTLRLNARRNLTGHVFSGRYKALVVDGSGNGYLRTVCDYVHLNPARAGLLKEKESVVDFPWSSLLWYAASPVDRPGWIRVDRLLGECGIRADTAAGRRELIERLEERRRRETAGEYREAWDAVRSDWCLGSDAFRKEMLERMEGGLGPNHAGSLKRETAENRAERILAEELTRAGWTEAELGRRAKSDQVKLRIAARLRRETTMTIPWIAARLVMGTPKSTTARMREWKRREEGEGSD